MQAILYKFQNLFVGFLGGPAKISPVTLGPQAKLGQWPRKRAKPGSGHQAAADRAQHQFGNAVQVHLFHDAPAMGLHGVEAQVEAVGDILIAVAFSQELVDLALAVGERVEAVVDFAGLA